MTLGNRIRAAREHLGLTLQDVGDAFAINRSSVSGWEADRTRPDQDKFPLLAKTLKVSLNWLVEGKGPGPGHSSTKRPDSGSPDGPVDPHTAGIAVRGTITMDGDGFWQLDKMLPGGGVVQAWFVEGTYALRLSGDAMWPRYKSGTVLVIDETAELEPDTDVVVVLKDGRATVRELAYRRGGEVGLRGFKDGQPMTLREADLRYIHAVVAAVLPSRFIAD